MHVSNRVHVLGGRGGLSSPQSSVPWAVVTCSGIVREVGGGTLRQQALGDPELTEYLQARASPAVSEDCFAQAVLHA